MPENKVQPQNLQKKQRNDFIDLSRNLTKLIVTEQIDNETYNINAISLYCQNEPMNQQQTAFISTKIREVFNLSAIKADYIVEIMYEENWSIERANDAIKHVMKTNIYNTGNVGLEPGKILSYDRLFKFYTQADVIKINRPNGTMGYGMIKLPFKHTLADGIVTDFWYVKDGDINVPEGI